MTAGVAYTSLDKLDRNYTSLLEKHTSSLAIVSGIELNTQGQISLLFGYLVDPSTEKEGQLAEMNSQLGTQIGTMVSAYDEEERECGTQERWPPAITAASVEVKNRDEIRELASERRGTCHSIDRVAEQTANGSREVYAHTEEQHAGVQEMMSAMDALSLLSEELQAMIGKFKV